MWTASSCRRGCRSNGRRGATTRTSGRCPATTRSWRTWPRRPHILRVKNRSGNVHDGKAGLPFLRALWPQLVGLRTGGARLRFRMDGAFFRQDVLRWLQGRGVGYAIKVPFYRWLDLQRYIRDSPTWVPVAPGVTGFAVPGAETPWHIPVTVTIYRKKVHHRATKNYQLDLFDPNDGHYEYSAVTSNLALTVRNVWYFACGRGNHEKTIAQLKTGLAFHSVPTQTYAANSAWQQLVVLAHNLLTNFQLETGAPPRRRTRKHTVVPLLQSVQTLRFELFHRAALLVRPGGKTLADDRQSPDASDVHPHCQRPRERLSF